jgi:hypothetical protein
VEDGMNYVDIRYQGTAASSNRCVYFLENGGTIGASIGQTWTFSLYAKIVAGAWPIGTPLFQINEQDSGGSLVTQANIGTAAMSSSATPLVQSRILATHTITGATTAFIRPALVSAILAIDTVVDVTFRIAAPQLELGAFATSPILPPPSAPQASTRASETGTMPFVVPSEFSLFSEFVTVARVSAAGGGSNHVTELNDGTSNNVFALLQRNTASPTMNLRVTVAGVNTNLTTDVLNLDVVQRQIGAYSSGNVASVANGGTVRTASGLTLPAMTKLRLASFGGGGEVTQSITYHRRVRLYGSRLSNAQLVALSGTGSSLVPAEVTGDSGTIAAEAEDANQGNVILTLPAPALGRYLRIDIENPTAAFTDIGVLAAGALWRTERSIAYGIEEGRLMLDRRDRNLFTGAEFPVPAIFNPRYARFTLPVLSDAEVKASHRELVRLLGAARDGLVIPDIADGLAERNRRALWGALNEPGGNAGTVMAAFSINERSFTVTERV